jgi:glycosyltransferase involved in cell wall biosynthesis
MTTKKIALISEHASPLAAAGGVDSGGQNIYVAQVARQLARLGHRVDVYTRRDDARQPDQVAWHDGVNVIHVPAGGAHAIAKERLMPLMPAFGAFLARRFAAQAPGYDVVHSNFFMSGYAAERALRGLDVPHVITFHALGRVRRRHQGAADQFDDSRFDIEERLCGSVDRIIAECPQDRTDLLELYGASDDRIDVVPCGFDGAEFEPQMRREARQRLGWPDDAFIVLQLGRMVPRKGVDTVVEAIAQLERRHRIKAELWIVGGNSAEPDVAATPEIGRLQALAQGSGVGPRVHFVGQRQRAELACYYNAADVFVTTPHYEPFGITPLEAMACAKPVVASAVGGLRSTVIDDVTGFLVPPRDAGAVADRLAWLAASPLLRAAMGIAGRQHVVENYTWNRVAERLDRIYESVTTARKRELEPERALT